MLALLFIEFPYANMTVVPVSSSGTAPPAEVRASTSSTNVLPGNDGRVTLRLRNAGTGPATVTFTLPFEVDGVKFTQQVTVPGESTVLVGHLKPDVYGHEAKFTVNATTVFLSAYRI